MATQEIVDQASEARAAAEHDARLLEREHNRAITEATRKIDEEYRPRREAAKAKVHAAQKAYEGAKIAFESNHPLVGKKVVKLETIHTVQWSRHNTGEKVEVYGQVEVLTEEARASLPANNRYGIPDVGDLVVRLYKKDGDLGAKVDRFSTKWMDAATWQSSQ